MYPKGALFINTLRHIVNNDEKWWKLILKYSETYRHKIIDTETVIDFFNATTGRNLTSVFNQYLRYTAIPKLEIRKAKKGIEYRWKVDEPNFMMPVDVVINNKLIRLEGTSSWKYTPNKVKSLGEIEVLKNKFYINY
jgi:aminopeptidase N